MVKKSEGRIAASLRLVGAGGRWWALVAAVGAATRPSGWWGPARHLTGWWAPVAPAPPCLFSFRGSAVDLLTAAANINQAIVQRFPIVADIFTVHCGGPLP